MRIAQSFSLKVHHSTKCQLTAFLNVHPTVTNLMLLWILKTLYARRLTLRDLQRRSESRFATRFYDAARESHAARAPRTNTVSFSAFILRLYLTEEQPHSQRTDLLQLRLACQLQIGLGKLALLADQQIFADLSMNSLSLIMLLWENNSDTVL
ncbi:hypothetical protein ARMSODRAFT_433318 [Armillaria solidipes]|uniref:Uncharacterized protein n=1 Tax=Armillaria solidipes TaxID=1076256 RepID=A0A2H3B7Q2_9AGAR|nr:hypothetical protein ARMSODRAFT_433318 [Armillaria solidipes]